MCFWYLLSWKGSCTLHYGQTNVLNVMQSNQQAAIAEQTEVPYKYCINRQHWFDPTDLQLSAKTTPAVIFMRLNIKALSVPMILLPGNHCHNWYQESSLNEDNIDKHTDSGKWQVELGGYRYWQAHKLTVAHAKLLTRPPSPHHTPTMPACYSNLNQIHPWAVTMTRVREGLAKANVYPLSHE